MNVVKAFNRCNAMLPKNLNFLPYYLNSRRIGQLSGFAIPLSSQISIAKNSFARVQAMDLALNVARQTLASGKIPNLVGLAATRSLNEERILAFVWGVFIFKGAPAAVDQEQVGKPVVPASFRGEIPLGDAIYSVSGQMFNEHYFSTSSMGVLSGRKRVLIAGHFQIKEGNIVDVSPYIIGELAERTDLFDFGFSSSVRVHPSQIDAFNKIATPPRIKKADIEAVQNMPEDTVKRAIAEIIGEQFVPKDWGGEKSDLQTSQITVGGTPMSAAFIFKGPSLKGEMHPANMGKRGDQLVRAFDEPVQLIVVQHCNKISNTVVRIAEALAYDPRNPRQYCIVDGTDTALILKAYGYI